MKKLVAALLGLCLLLSAACAGSILPSLKTTDGVQYAPALRSVADHDTPSPTNEGGGKKDYTYKQVSLDAFEAFGLALARAGYVLDATETDEESGNVTMDLSCADIRLKIVYNPDNEVMTVTYPKGVLPSPDKETDRSLEQDASIAQSILPVIGVRYAPSISQVSFLTDKDPDTLSSGAQQYYYSPFNPIIYERFSAKLGEEGYSLVSVEQTEGETEQVIVVAKGSVELTLHYDSNYPRMKVDYPQRVKPEEGDLAEYTRDLAVNESYQADRSGVIGTVTLITTVQSYTEDWRSVTPWFTRTDSSTYYAEEEDEVFLWMSFLEENRSADFTSRAPYSKITVKLITGGEVTEYDRRYSGASSRAGYVNTRSGANEPIEPLSSAPYQVVFEIPRAEFEAAEEIYAEIIDRDYAYKYVICIKGENGQLTQE